MFDMLEITKGLALAWDWLDGEPVFGWWFGGRHVVFLPKDDVRIVN